MPWRSARAALRLDARELLASRALWVLLFALGPLLGHSFIAAVALFSEASAGALAQGLDPLDGVVVPTLGVYGLASTLLFPFVAIRLLAGERDRGGLALRLQAPLGAGAQIAGKAIVLLGVWVAALAPGVVALALFGSYGGHLHEPAIWTVLLGHALRGWLAAGLGLAAAAAADSAATAALLALAATLGTWALDFVAAGRGGALERLAAFTPEAALRWFEQGLLRLDVVLVLLLLGAGLVALAAVLCEPGLSRWRRAARIFAVCAATSVACLSAARARGSVDVSEDLRNSFPAADQQALRLMSSPLRISVHLAPQDPRLADFERGVLRPLRRALPGVEIAYSSSTRTGLFEGAGYGEIVYRIGDNEARSRSTIPRIALEVVYGLAGVRRRTDLAEPRFAGHPLVAAPRGAAVLFFAVLPALAVLGFALTRIARSRPCAWPS